jgi:signal transduction histidine kinase
MKAFSNTIKQLLQIRLKPFLQRHGLLIGFLAATLPLLIIIFMHYRSLATLETTLPAYRKEVWRAYLRTLIGEAEAHYRAQADKVLAVPASAIQFRQGNVFRDEQELGRLVKAVERAAEHFKGREFRGATSLFVVVAIIFGPDAQRRSAVLFYNPQRQTMELNPQAPEWVNIHLASAEFMVRIRNGMTDDPQVIKADWRADHRLVLKPIVDASHRVIAIAGLPVDQTFFWEGYLRGLIQSSLPSSFPNDYRDAVITLRDNEGQVLRATPSSPLGEPEVRVPFTMIFQGWELGMHLQQTTETQLARRYFVINLALWLVLTSLLVAGLVLALRTASREVRLSQLKSDFVSNVSHELRTPLASIRVFGEFFRLGLVKEPERMREFGAYIETESRRLTQLINNILDFSRIESGLKAYHFETLDVGELLSDTLKMLEVRLKQSSFAVQFDAPPTPLPALIDAEAMTQVFVNLLDNAVKYSGAAREIKVRLSAEAGWVTVAISDQGIGISEADQEKIFERFHRVSTGLVHDVKGSGLGLAIVKHIVEAHRGRVTVNSAPGRGSTFSIYLPLQNDVESALEAPHSAVLTVALTDTHEVRR